MNRREADALDRHITGNYGEDQYRDIESDDDITPDTIESIARQERLPVAVIRRALRESHRDAGPSEVIQRAHEINEGLS
jgi:hypothetical protein